MVSAARVALASCLVAHQVRGGTWDSTPLFRVARTCDYVVPMDEGRPSFDLKPLLGDPNLRMTTPATETLAKVEVLADLEPLVKELMVAHEAKRILWFPSELLAPAPDTDPDHHIRELRERAAGISLPGRVALALNLLTEEGLPHFHRLLAVYLGSDSF